MISAPSASDKEMSRSVIGTCINILKLNPRFIQEGSGLPLVLILPSSPL